MVTIVTGSPGCKVTAAVSNDISGYCIVVKALHHVQHIPETSSPGVSLGSWCSASGLAMK